MFQCLLMFWWCLQCCCCCSAPFSTPSSSHSSSSPQSSQFACSGQRAMHCCFHFLLLRGMKNPLQLYLAGMCYLLRVILHTLAMFVCVFYQPLLCQVICLDSFPLASHNGYSDLSCVLHTHSLDQPHLKQGFGGQRGIAIQKAIIGELASSTPILISSSSS